MMMDHPTSLSCRLAWGSKPADGLEGSIHLNPFVWSVGRLLFLPPLPNGT